jgi:hypothetical protein
LGAGAGYSLHLPSNTASLLTQQITVTCNGVQQCNINAYNLLYTAAYDLAGAHLHKPQNHF